MNLNDSESHPLAQQQHAMATPAVPWPDHLLDHARHLHSLFKASLLALASSDPLVRQSALDLFNQCSKSLAQRLVRTVAAVPPSEPGSKRAIEQEIAKLQHHIHHQRQTIASTRARLNSWYDQLAVQSDLAHGVIEARAYGGTLPPGIGIGSPPSSSSSSARVNSVTSSSSSSLSSSPQASSAATPAGGTAATSAATSATASMSAATSESKPGSSSAMAASDVESSSQLQTDNDNDNDNDDDDDDGDQSSVMSGYPSSSGGDALLDDESSLPPDWEERINAETAAEAGAEMGSTRLSDRSSSMSGFVVEDEDTMASSAVGTALDNVSGISDVVMAEVEQRQQQDPASATATTSNPSERMGASGAVTESGDAGVDSISLSGLGSEIPPMAPTPAPAAARPGVGQPSASASASAQAVRSAPTRAGVQQHAPQQPLQHPAQRVHQHPFSSATAFLHGDSDSSSEEDDDD